MSKSRPTSSIDTIIIHCADTPNGGYRCAEDVDDWHSMRTPPFLRGQLVRGKTNVSTHLKHIGYHFVIETTGDIRQGRALEETGAHAKGHNINSIGICLIGTDAFTAEQWGALQKLVRTLSVRFPLLKIIGHRDVDPGKTCPGFDVGQWLRDNMMPHDPNLYVRYR